MSDALAAALADGRREAEALMTSTCTISRDGESVWDPETLQNEDAVVVLYTGPCRVKPAGSQDRGQDAADQAFVESQYVLSLPVAGSEAIRSGDRVTIDASPDDVALAGRKYTVVAGPAYSQGTARRVPVRESQ